MSSWKEYKLGEIATFYNGRAYKNTEFKVSGTPIVRIQNLTGEGKIVYSDLNLDENKYIDYGDLIYAWSATFGPYIWKGEKSIYHYHIWKIICNEELLDKKYFYYKLKQISDNLKDSGGNGSIFVHITKAFMENFKVKIPSLNEQKRVSSILAYLDEKIQLNTQINQTLEQIAQTIFKSWFIDFDPVHAKANALASGQTAEQATQAAMAVISGKNTQELHRLQTANPEQYQQLWEITEAFPSGFDEEGVPRGWESKKVGEVAKIVKGKKPKLISSEPDDGFLPHILMASLSGKYTEYAQIDKSIVCDIFDTLILMDGAASGKIAIGHKGVIGSTFAKMELSENKYWALFNLFMFSKEQDIQANTTGTSIPHTDKARVLDYEIIVPCDVVLNYFTEMYKNILCSILNQRKNSFILENIRDLLLPKLLSGEILNGN